MANKALNLFHQSGQHHRSLGGLCALWAWVVLACTAAFSGLFAQTAHAATGERVALLIGNARYSSGLPPLLNPPQDVAALEASLKKLGFRVQVLKDGDQKAMGRAIKQFGTQAQEAQVAFFYYSGHGMQAREENYLIPVGAGIESEADLDIEAVALRSLMRQIDEARPQNAVVVLDACRDNPVAARTKSASKGLSRINSQPTNTLVVFAALAGNTASDNGVFARALASHITQPNLGLRGVFDNVNKAVRQASGNKQSIQRDDQLSEDVVLLAAARPEPSAFVRPGGGSFIKEGAYWVEYPPYAPGKNFRFNEIRKDQTHLYVADETRFKENDRGNVMLMRFPLSGGVMQWSYSNPIHWIDLYLVSPQ